MDTQRDTRTMQAQRRDHVRRNRGELPASEGKRPQKKPNQLITLPGQSAFKTMKK